MTKPFQIVLIDDNHTTNFLNEMVVSRSGHGVGVTSFTDPSKALDFFQDEVNQSNRYLIFLDINMPIMDGWGFADAYAKLQLLTNNVIVMLTSSVDPRDKERAMEHPAIQDYHSKPLSFEVLNEVLSAYF